MAVCQASLLRSVSFYKRHFPFSFFLFFFLLLRNAVLKEVVSAFASICSQQDSVKHYTEPRWPNSGCDILLSYFTKHRVLSLNRSLVALHDKTIPSLCGPASLQTVGTIAALSGVCTALGLKISECFVLSYLIRHLHIHQMSHLNLICAHIWYDGFVEEIWMQQH